MPEIEIFDVNSDDIAESLSKFKVCISCVGPFRFYGRAIVEGCIKAKTDYVDICGETEFIEGIYADWNDAATKSNVSIVSSCGYDSIPSDLGVLYVKTKFKEAGAVCANVEFYANIKTGRSGLGINATTFFAAIHSFDKYSILISVESLRKVRKRINANVSYVGPVVKVAGGIHWSERICAYASNLY